MQRVVMDLLAIGTNYRTADAEWRRRLAIPAADLPAWLADATRHPALSEIFVLSTCNRVELYVATPDVRAAERELRRSLAPGAGEDLFAEASRWYRLTDEGASRHLCRVACGLDSMLVGEAEILGQVRTAVELARGTGTLGATLQRVAAAALEAGRRARTETGIGRGALSAAGAAVTLGERHFGSLEGRAALVIGAGHAARLALTRLAKRHCGRLIICNRSREHGQELARLAGAEALALDAIPAVLAGVDLAIAAVPSPTPIVTRESLRQTTGRTRPLVIVDLGMPPGVDPDVARESWITWYGIDDLRQVTDETAERRRREIPRVEAIAAEEAARVFADALVGAP
jgi:glutamyl-tRNA reductase